MYLWGLSGEEVLSPRKKTQCPGALSAVERMAVHGTMLSYGPNKADLFYIAMLHASMGPEGNASTSMDPGSF